MKGCFSMEFYINTAIQVSTMLVTLGAIYGMFKKELQFISKDIKRLEEKQDKYNNLQSRVAVLETILNQRPD